MKNKALCKTCKYRGTIGSRTGTGEDITCDYSMTSTENRTCLVKKGVDVIDRRGNDYNTCLLYEPGQQIGRARNSSEFVEVEVKKHRRIGDARRKNLDE